MSTEIRYGLGSLELHRQQLQQTKHILLLPSYAAGGEPDVLQSATAERFG